MVIDFSYNEAESLAQALYNILTNDASKMDNYILSEFLLRLTTELDDYVEQNYVSDIEEGESYK